jgi:hypothetical protein
MKCDIKTITDLLYNLNFASNTFANKTHENSVKQIFIDNGLREINKSDDKFKNFLKHRKNSTKTIDELKDCFLFIEQPFGSQSAPDFIICVDGYILWVECKSGSGKITWNTGYPKTDILFVFSCKKKNTTNIFFGQSHSFFTLDPDFETNFSKEIKNWRANSKKEFKSKFSSSFFDFHARPMLVDKTKYSDPSTRSDFYNKANDILSK